MLRPVGSQTTERLNDTASASVPRPPSYPHLSLLLRGLKPESPPLSLQGVVRREGSGDHRGVSVVSVRAFGHPRPVSPPGSHSHCGRERLKEVPAGTHAHTFPGGQF